MASIFTLPWIHTLYNITLWFFHKKEEECITHSWCLNWIMWLSLANRNECVLFTQPIWLRAIWFLLLFHLCHCHEDMPGLVCWGWKTCGAEPEVTPFAPDKASLDQPMASQPQDMWLSPAKNSRRAWLTPSWPQRVNNMHLLLHATLGFVVACHASCSITEAIDGSVA